VVQRHRLPRRTPADASNRYGTGLGPDILSDREIEVVAVEARCGVARSVPELRKTGVEVDLGFAPNAVHQRLERQMARDVDEEVGGFGDAQ
jgi:hypothetical protein